MELYFIISIIGLLLVTLISFILMAKETRWTLAILVPILSASGILGIISYKSLLGYPVKMEWKEMPQQWTVIFFRVERKSTITIWLLQNNKTRLVQLPYMDGAENALQAQKTIMGQGIPVTFGENGSKKGEQKEAGQDWGYRIKSYGEPIESEGLPVK